VTQVRGLFWPTNQKSDVITHDRVKFVYVYDTLSQARNWDNLGFRMAALVACVFHKTAFAIKVAPSLEFEGT
jgi:hypothetical protein